MCVCVGGILSCVDGAGVAVMVMAIVLSSAEPTPRGQHGPGVPATGRGADGQLMVVMAAPGFLSFQLRLACPSSCPGVSPPQGLSAGRGQGARIKAVVPSAMPGRLERQRRLFLEQCWEASWSWLCLWGVEVL